MLSRIFTKISRVPAPTFLAGLNPKFTYNPVTLNTTSIRFFSNGNQEKNPIPQMIHTDKEFTDAVNQIDMETIEKEAHEMAFKTSLQAYSIKLLQATNSTEALEIFEDTFKENPNMSGEELCMTLYFTCYYKDNVVGDERFHQLIDNVFKKIDSATSLYLFALIHSLGIYCFDFGLKLSTEQQQKLGGVVLKNIDEFELNQISATSWAVSQIISDYENKDLKTKVIDELGNILLVNSSSLTGLDYANMLSTFSQSGITTSPTIDKFVDSINKNLVKLENEDLVTITRLVMALGEIQLKDRGVLMGLFDDIIRPQIHNFTVDDISALILVYAEKFPEQQTYFKEMIKNIHVNFKDITITSYMNVWLALAKLRIQAADIEKTLGILRQVPWSNNIWKPNDLEAFEIVNILVAMSTIKMNDKQFLQNIIVDLAPKLKDLDNMDLVNLTRAFTLYVKQDEDFYLKIHQECCDRERHLSSQERNLLKETFTKARQFLPSSPFVDVTLY